jgi:RNA recognition motif-containing protein
MTNIYVGNLSYQTTSDDLETLFSEYGEVTRAKVVNDRDTGRSKGFGFVEMANENDAQEAIEALNERSVGGRNLKVNVARPREERPRRW